MTTFYRPSPMTDDAFRTWCASAETVPVPLETVRRILDELAAPAFHDYREKRQAGQIQANDAAHIFFHVMAMHGAMRCGGASPEERLGELVGDALDLREVSA